MSHLTLECAVVTTVKGIELLLCPCFTVFVVTNRPTAGRNVLQYELVIFSAVLQSRTLSPILILGSNNSYSGKCSQTSVQFW
jgi:hypothetical protein